MTSDIRRWRAVGVCTRMGWQFPYVSTYNADFGLAMTEEQAQQIPEVKKMINYSFLLERTPKAQPAEPRTWRKDEYSD